MKNKKKIDKEIYVLSESLKKMLNIYSAMGTNFSFNCEGIEVSLSQNLLNEVCHPKGFLSIFINEVNNEIKKDDFLGRKEGLPLIYVNDPDALLCIYPEIYETDKAKETPVLFLMLSGLDYVLSEKRKAAYKDKYQDKAEIEFQKNTPIDVDISSMYNNFKNSFDNEMLFLMETPKYERIKNNRVKKPTFETDMPSSKQTGMRG